MKNLSPLYVAVFAFVGVAWAQDPASPEPAKSAPEAVKPHGDPEVEAWIQELLKRNRHENREIRASAEAALRSLGRLPATTGPGAASPAPARRSRFGGDGPPGGRPGGGPDRSRGFHRDSPFPKEQAKELAWCDTLDAGIRVAGERKKPILLIISGARAAGANPEGEC